MARKEWLANSDRNSRYFHQLMKVRKSRSKIIKIKDSFGVWVNDLTQLQHLFVNEFKARFKSSHTCTSSFRLDLPEKVSEGEITSL